MCADTEVEEGSDVLFDLDGGLPPEDLSIGSELERDDDAVITSSYKSPPPAKSASSLEFFSVLNEMISQVVV
jgi:hypothetical protein